MCVSVCTCVCVLHSTDCPLQQYLVFVLPYPVMEPILTLQSPEGGDVPFDLQLLTSDLENVVRPVDIHEQVRPILLRVCTTDAVHLRGS